MARPRKTSRPRLPYSLSKLPYGDAYKVTISLGSADGRRQRRYVTLHAIDEPHAHVQAAAWVAQQAAAADAPAPSAPTVEAWAEKWMGDHVARRLTVSTQRQYRWALDRIIPAIGHIRLDQLKPKHIAQWLANLDEAGVRTDGRGERLSGASQMRAYRTLSSMLQEAVYDGLLDANPARGVKPPRQVATQARSYDAATVAALLRALATTPARWQALIWLDVSTGMRRGEVCGLRWEDVDWAAGKIRVRRALLAQGTHRYLVTTPKSAAGVRTVRLIDVVADPLRRWRAEQDALASAAGARWQNAEGYVFTDVHGRPLNPDYVTRAWARFVDAAKLPPLPFHGLRHTAATILIAAGVPIRIVAEILGHSQASFTLNTYAHVHWESIDAAGDAMQGALSPKVSPNPEK